MKNCFKSVTEIKPKKFILLLTESKKWSIMGTRPKKWYEVVEKVVGSVDEERKAELTPAQAALLDKYRHLLHRGFRGAYVHGLDAKGRMIVPASFRQSLGDKFYICMTPDFKAIAIYPQREWELYYCSLLELAEKDMRMERVINLFSKYTYDECECDAQGRVLLPQKLRTRFLQDARDVEVSGAGTHIRVMRNEDAQSEEEAFEAEIPDVLAFEAEIAARRNN